MDMQNILIPVLVFSLVALLVATPVGAFIGAGINMDKHLGDTINFRLDPVVQVPGVGYGLENMDLGVTWGADYNLDALAGYPYGYGAVGAVTTGNVGYTLGLSMDEAHGAGFDGSSYGVPLTEGTVTRTKYNQIVAGNQAFQDTQAALVF